MSFSYNTFGHSSRNVSTLKGVLSLKFKTGIVFPKAAPVKSGLK